MRFIAAISYFYITRKSKDNPSYQTAQRLQKLFQFISMYPDLQITAKFQSAS